MIPRRAQWAREEREFRAYVADFFAREREEKLRVERRRARLRRLSLGLLGRE